MISIIDYEMGNLRSVQKALEKVGSAAEITTDPKVIAASDGIILPGVGSFGAAMKRLNALVPVIKEAAAKGKPFLGVCLGLQLIFDKSEENSGVAGLGLLPGEVLRFELPDTYKIPHMGWNEVKWAKNSPIFKNIPDNYQMYFVHAYHAVPRDKDVILGSTDYGGTFTSAVQKGNIYGTQFHPEKSGEIGLELYRNFAKLCKA